MFVPCHHVSAQPSGVQVVACAHEGFPGNSRYLLSSPFYLDPVIDLVRVDAHSANVFWCVQSRLVSAITSDQARQHKKCMRAVAQTSVVCMAKKIR